LSARCAKHWKEQFTELDALVREHGADLLGQADFGRYKLMQDFSHRVGDMLALITDTLQPADFEELKKHGFADDGPAADRSVAPAPIPAERAGSVTDPTRP
jgi:internalin A